MFYVKLIKHMRKNNVFFRSQYSGQPQWVMMNFPYLQSGINSTRVILVFALTQSLRNTKHTC